MWPNDKLSSNRPMRTLRRAVVHLSKLIRGRGCSSHRKCHAESCAPGTSIEAFDGAEMLLNDSVAYAQAEACAFSHRLRRKKWIEDVSGRLDTRTRVRHLDHYI